MVGVQGRQPKRETRKGDVVEEEWEGRSDEGKNFGMKDTRNVC